MRCDQANSIPAQLYLQYKGFRPAHTRLNGRELWYVSPIRSKEHTPSFKVDVILNRWFDHGLGKGGKTLDLAIEICRCSVREALSDIERSGLFNDLGHSKNQTATLEHVGSVFEQRKIAYEKENEARESVAFRLLSETELKHPALLEYLDARKIDPKIAMAQRNLRQIHFEPASGEKHFSALGWKSGQGHEARNMRFKGFVGAGKEITYLKAPKASVCVVFEGFMDYLSYLSQEKITKPNFSAITLNTGRLKIKALPHIIKGRYKTLKLFMDNDTLGDECVEFFQRALKSVNIKDMRSQYQGYKDYNEKAIKNSP